MPVNLNEDLSDLLKDYISEILSSVKLILK